MARINEDPAVARYLRNPPGTAFTHTETDDLVDHIREHWERHGFGLYAATLRQTGELIGFLGLAIPSFLPEILPAVEAGWRLDAAVWGRGLATEGALACMRVAFDDLGLDEVVSIGHAENGATLRVMEKLGMRPYLEAVHPAHGWPLRVYRLERSEWEETQDGLRG